MKKICVVASGGDCPAMNACVEAVYTYGKEKGFEVWAGINGYNGLIFNEFVKMTDQNALGISGRGGCVFKCGRASTFLSQPSFNNAVKNVKKAGFSAVIVLGGNGSTDGAGRLKNAGLPMIVIPATIDNDVDFTKNSLGFSSACESAVRQLDDIRATMETGMRDYAVVLMGRHCNEMTKRIGTATFAEVIDMEGDRHTPEQIAKIFKANRAAGKTCNMVLTQEKKSATHVTELREGADFVEALWNATGDKNIRMQTLGYLQRGAVPSCFDRFIAVLYGRASVDCVLANKLGVGLSVVNDQVEIIDLKLSPIPE
jgi:6-phosphofructokinase 1